MNIAQPITKKTPNKPAIKGNAPFTFIDPKIGVAEMRMRMKNMMNKSAAPLIAAKPKLKRAIVLW